MDAKMVTLVGGVEMTAQKLDGTTEAIKVRQLPVRLLQEYAGKIGNEADMVELFCDKPKGWADSLTFESHGAIVEQGEELNKEHFFGWLQRQVQRQEKLLPRMQSLSPTMLQKSP